MPRVSGLVGILGPSVFVLAFTILGQFSPGYSPTTDVISNLELVKRMAGFSSSISWHGRTQKIHLAG
jgi:hypothetical protein